MPGVERRIDLSILDRAADLIDARRPGWLAWDQGGARQDVGVRRQAGQAICRHALQAGLIAEQRDGRSILNQRDVQVGDHLGGRRAQPGEQVDHSRVDVRTRGSGARHRTIGEVIDVVTFVGGQPQGARQCCRHLF